MANKLEHLKELDEAIGDGKTEIKQKKSLILLEDISKKLTENKKLTTEETKAIVDTITKLIDSSSTLLKKEDIKFLDEFVKHIVKSQGDLQEDVVKGFKSVVDEIKSQTFPTKVEITNLQKFPEEITVKNPQKDVKILNLDEIKIPEQKEFPKEIKVSNFPKQKEFPVDIIVSKVQEPIEFKKPSWYSPINYSTFLTTLNSTLQKTNKDIVKAVKDASDKVVKIDAKKHERPENAIAVKLVDGSGKIIKELIPKVIVNPPGYAGGPGGGVSTTEILNKLQQMFVQLQAINTNTDTLEVSIDNIELDADAINLNTDTLEALLADVATETTLALIKAAIDNIKTNTDNLTSDPATETTLASIKTSVETIDNFISGSKGLVTEDNSQGILDAVSPYDGSTGDESVALASADTWYAIPSSPPAAKYEMVVSLENADGTIRWSFNNGGVPSATNGNLAPNHITLKMPASTSAYFGSSTAGDDVNVTWRQI